jgi:hypothetical protein
MSLLPTMTDLKKLSPAWWGAVAGAVAAGASLAPNARILGGAAGGAAMLLLAHKMSSPCCAECAGAAASSGAASSESAPTSLLSSNMPAMAKGCTDCASSGIDELS